jgi:hypothetical protein
MARRRWRVLCSQVGCAGLPALPIGGGDVQRHETMIDADENYRRMLGRSQNDPDKLKECQKGSKRRL